jgi:uncharacterized protein YkwD
MRARIVATVALIGLALGLGPAVAEECPVTDQLLEQCPSPTPPTSGVPEPQPEPTPPPSLAPGHQPDAVSRLLGLLNEERRQRGMALFALREDVSSQSRRHSEAMAAGGTIWHNDAYFTAANKKRLNAVLLGENVARNVDIDDAHRRLMNSPGHRANILDRRFSGIGLGVYRSSTGSLYVTESFVQPVSPAPAPARPARAELPRSTPGPAPTTTTVAVPEPLPVAAPVVLAAGAVAALAPMALDRSGSKGTPWPQLVVALLLLGAAAALGAPLVGRIRR